MMKITIIIVSISLIVAATTLIQVSGEFVPPQSGRSANLLKRSLCNTFGGCGAKRSMMPQASDYRLSDESTELKRHDVDAKLIKEILEDIVEHLRKDQDYKRGRYVMLVPKVQTTDGSSYLQPMDAIDGSNDLQSISNNIRINSEEEPFQPNRG